MKLRVSSNRLGGVARSDVGAGGATGPGPGLRQVERRAALQSGRVGAVTEEAGGAAAAGGSDGAVGVAVVEVAEARPQVEPPAQPVPHQWPEDGLDYLPGRRLGVSVSEG